MGKANKDLPEKLSTDSKGSKSNPLPLFHVEHLKEPCPWTMDMAGLVKWLSWQTGNILGMSKIMLVNRAIEETIKQSGNEDYPSKDVAKTTRRKVRQDPKWITPPWIQHKLRVETEDYLNKEFDIFLSLMPDGALNEYLSTFFQGIANGTWQVHGNSNDFEYSTGMRFMQMDTLAYSAATNTLVALELKVDAPVGKDQVLKYCYMVAFLEKKKFINPNTVFKLLFISAEEMDSKAHLQKARDEIDTCPLPRRGTTEEEMLELKPRVRQLLSSLEMETTTWRELGAHFADTLGRTPKGDGIYHKLVDGFLWSLSIKEGKQGKLYEKISQPAGVAGPGTVL